VQPQGRPGPATGPGDLGRGVVDQALTTRRRAAVEPEFQVGQPAGLPGRGERPYQAGGADARAAQHGDDRPPAVIAPPPTYHQPGTSPP
jgi:hypothetical protein